MTDLTPNFNRLQRDFGDYAAFHVTLGNKLCHYLGIPLITLSMLGLLSHIQILQTQGLPIWFSLNGGTLLWVLSFLFYLRLDWRVALPFSVTSLGMYVIGTVLSLATLWVLFIIGWTVQFLGHSVYEKKRPAFYSNLRHLLIGPLWIFDRLIRGRT